MPEVIGKLERRSRAILNVMECQTDHQNHGSLVVLALASRRNILRLGIGSENEAVQTIARDLVITSAQRDIWISANSSGPPRGPTVREWMALNP